MLALHCLHAGQDLSQHCAWLPGCVLTSYTAHAGRLLDNWATGPRQLLAEQALQLGQALQLAGLLRPRHGTSGEQPCLLSRCRGMAVPAVGI